MKYVRPSEVGHPGNINALLEAKGFQKISHFRVFRNGRQTSRWLATSEGYPFCKMVKHDIPCVRKGKRVVIKGLALKWDINLLEKLWLQRYE